VYLEILGEFNFNPKKTDVICKSVYEAGRNFFHFCQRPAQIRYLSVRKIWSYIR